MKGYFWWRDNLRLLTAFKGMATVSVKDVLTCHLWTDQSRGMVPYQVFPKLFSFAKNQSINIHNARAANEISQPFHLPLFAEAFDQLQ